MDKGEVSPDGEWVIIIATNRVDAERLAVPIRGDVPRKICDACTVAWSPDGSLFYVGSALSDAPTFARRTLVIPVPAGKALPDLPVGGINPLDRAIRLPGVLTIEGGLISPGSDPST